MAVANSYFLPDQQGGQRTLPPPQPTPTQQQGPEIIMQQHPAVGAATPFSTDNPTTTTTPNTTGPAESGEQQQQQQQQQQRPPLTGISVYTTSPQPHATHPSHVTAVMQQQEQSHARPPVSIRAQLDQKLNSCVHGEMDRIEIWQLIYSLLSESNRAVACQIQQQQQQQQRQRDQHQQYNLLSQDVALAAGSTVSPLAVNQHQLHIHHQQQQQQQMDTVSTNSALSATSPLSLVPVGTNTNTITTTTPTTTTTPRDADDVSHGGSSGYEILNHAGAEAVSTPGPLDAESALPPPPPAVAVAVGPAYPTRRETTTSTESTKEQSSNTSSYSFDTIKAAIVAKESSARANRTDPTHKKELLEMWTNAAATCRPKQKVKMVWLDRRATAVQKMRQCIDKCCRGDANVFFQLPSSLPYRDWCLYKCTCPEVLPEEDERKLHHSSNNHVQEFNIHENGRKVDYRSMRTVDGRYQENSEEARPLTVEEDHCKRTAQIDSVTHKKNDKVNHLLKASWMAIADIKKEATLVAANELTTKNGTGENNHHRAIAVPKPFPAMAKQADSSSDVSYSEENEEEIIVGIEERPAIHGQRQACEEGEQKLEEDTPSESRQSNSSTGEEKDESHAFPSAAQESIDGESSDYHIFKSKEESQPAAAPANNYASNVAENVNVEQTTGNNGRHFNAQIQASLRRRSSDSTGYDPVPAHLREDFHKLHAKIIALEAEEGKTVSQKKDLISAWTELKDRYGDLKDLLRKKNWVTQRQKALENVKSCIAECHQDKPDKFFQNVQLEYSDTTGSLYKCSCNKGSCNTPTKKTASQEKGTEGPQSKRRRTNPMRQTQTMKTLKVLQDEILQFEKDKSDKLGTLRSWETIIELADQIPDELRASPMWDWIRRRRLALKHVDDCIKHCWNGDSDDFHLHVEWIPMSYQCRCARLRKAKEVESPKVKRRVYI